MRLTGESTGMCDVTGDELYDGDVVVLLHRRRVRVGEVVVESVDGDADAGRHVFCRPSHSRGSISGVRMRVYDDGKGTAGVLRITGFGEVPDSGSRGMVVAYVPEDFTPNGPFDRVFRVGVVSKSWVGKGTGVAVTPVVTVRGCAAEAVVPDARLGIQVQLPERVDRSSCVAVTGAPAV